MRVIVLSFLVCVSLVSWSKPIKSILSGRYITSLEERQPIQNPYVTDGLVAMWHRDFNTGASGYDMDSPIWMDCVNNITLKLENGMEWVADGLYIPQKVNSQIPIPSVLSGFNNNSWSINIVFKKLTRDAGTPTVFAIGKYVIKYQVSSVWQYDNVNVISKQISISSTAFENLHSFTFSGDTTFLDGSSIRYSQFSYNFQVYPETREYI